MDDGLFFGLENWGEFGQRRYRATLAAGEKLRIPLVVPAGRWLIVFKYRFGEIYNQQGVLQTDAINFRFDGVRNYFEQDILIGTELLNFVVEPKPYIIISGRNGAILVENTDDEEQDFSIVLDFIVIDNEIKGRIRELVLTEREKFRGKITSQAGTGGA